MIHRGSKKTKKQGKSHMSLTRLSSSLSVRLQASAIFLSFVGVAFGVKSYLHVKHQFGAEAAQVFHADLMLQLVVALVVNIVVSIVLFQITTKPIKRLSEVMRALTEGHLEVEVPYVAQSTEIGSMARKVEIFKKNAVEKVALEQQQKQAEQKQRDEKKKAMNDLANRFEMQVGGILDEVVAEVAKVKTLSEQMGATIRSASQKTSVATSAIDQTSRNVNTVASAAEQMSASVREVAGQIQKSSQSVKDAVSANQTANEVATMLSAAANKIGEIVSLIQSIAGQINLLALNATIESARAGEAGKGFAVVANEVKNLASQTGRATDEIASQIENIQAVSKQVMHALTTISSSIVQVDNYSGAIASAIHQQSAATDEIANNIAGVASRTQDITNDIMDVNSASNAASQTVEHAMEAVNLLEANTERLNQAMTSFLKDVRAA